MRQTSLGTPLSLCFRLIFFLLFIKISFTYIYEQFAIISLQEGYGIGDDQYSIAFDGCRRLIWHNAKSLSHDLPVWSGGSILGCLLDLDAREVIFSINGIEGGVLKQVFGSARWQMITLKNLFF